MSQEHRGTYQGGATAFHPKQELSSAVVQVADTLQVYRDGNAASRIGVARPTFSHFVHPEPAELSFEFEGRGTVTVDYRDSQHFRWA